MNKKTLIILIVVLGIVVILPTLLAITGSLAYFGILSPKNILPEVCELQMGLDCDDYRLNTAKNQIELSITNNNGQDMIVKNISAASTEGFRCSTEFNEELKNGETHDFVISGCAFPKLRKDKKIKVELEMIWYTHSPDYAHSMHGYLMAAP
jgi:hypothetical protein